MEAHLAYLENRIRTLDEEQWTIDNGTERKILGDLLTLVRSKAMCYIEKLPGDILLSIILRHNLTITEVLTLSLVCRGAYKSIRPVFMQMVAVYRTRHPLAGDSCVGTFECTVSYRLPSPPGQLHSSPSSPQPPRKIRLPPPAITELGPCFRCQRRGHFARECPL